jgi:hypothetical protein
VGYYLECIVDTGMEESALSQYLQDALREHASVKDSILSSYKLLLVHVPDETPP